MASDPALRYMVTCIQKSTEHSDRPNAPTTVESVVRLPPLVEAVADAEADAVAAGISEVALRELLLELEAAAEAVDEALAAEAVLDVEAADKAVDRTTAMLDATEELDEAAADDAVAGEVDEATDEEVDEAMEDMLDEVAEALPTIF